MKRFLVLVAIASVGVIPAGAEVRETLEPATVRLSDLPDGFSVGTPTLDNKESDEEGTFCADLDSASSTEDLPEFESTFAGGSFGPFVQSRATKLAKGKGKKTFARFVQLLDRCKPETKTNADGTIETSTISRMKVPKLGDESAGYRLVLTGAIVPISADMVVTRKGDVFSVIVVAGVGQLNPPVVDLAKKVAPRMSKAR